MEIMSGNFNFLSYLAEFAVTCIGAGLGAGITIFGSNKLAKRSEKKQKRALISVGIFDNIKEDIDDRLNNDRNVWFLDSDVLASYENNRVYYLNVMQNNKSIFIHNCKMRIEKDDGKVIYNYDVGSLTERDAMVPLKVRNNTKSVALILNYMTEENEVMLYRMNIEFDRGEIVGINDLWGKCIKQHKTHKIIDCYLYDKYKRCKYQVVISDDGNFIDRCYSGKEIKKMLNGKSLNYSNSPLQHHKTMKNTHINRKHRRDRRIK